MGKWKLISALGALAALVAGSVWLSRGSPAPAEPAPPPGAVQASTEMPVSAQKVLLQGLGMT